jgi:hypothetical protein
MGYYNTGVNVALCLGGGTALTSEKISGIRSSVSIPSAWNLEPKAPPSPAARTGHPQHSPAPLAELNSPKVVSPGRARA